MLLGPDKSDEVFVLSTLMLPPPYVEKIKQVSSNVRFEQCNDLTELAGLSENADVLLLGSFSREMLLAAKKVKWIQAMFAGVDALLIPEVVISRTIITSAGGVNVNPVSDHVMGLMLCLSRKLHVFIRNQAERKWKSSDRDLMDQLGELSGQTLGIVGQEKSAWKWQGKPIASECESSPQEETLTHRNLHSWTNYILPRGLTSF